MEEGAHSLSNDDLLRLISFLEYDVLLATAVALRAPESKRAYSALISRRNPQAAPGYPPQSAARYDPLYSGASQVPFPLSALPPQATPMHPGGQPFPSPYGFVPTPHLSH